MANNGDEDEIKSAEEEGEEAGSVNVRKFLGGVEYPATKDDLIDRAGQNGAEDDVLDMLDLLPDMDYNGPGDVTRELATLNDEE
jgi:uncharacterized protein DUF2795